MTTLKTPWGEGTPWKSSVAFFTYLRGCLRKAWSRNPIKLEVLKKKRKRISNPNPRGAIKEVWGFDCAVCEKTLPLKEGQVDHIVPAGSLTRVEDIQGFVQRLLFVREEDLRLVCKDCNSTLAYAERQGLSFEEAQLQKRVITITKKPAAEIKAWLLAKGCTPASNAAARRKQIKEVLENEQRGNY